MWTPDGILAGREAIATFYKQIFSILPSGLTTLEMRQMVIAGNKAFLVWSDDSSVAQIPLGTESLEINKGKIIWQSYTAQIIQK